VQCPGNPVALCDWPRRAPRGRPRDPGSGSRRTPDEDRRKIEQPLAATPAAWRDFTLRNAELAARLTQE